MIRQRAFVLIVLVAVGTALLLPQSRRVMRLQATCAFTGQDYPGRLPGGADLPTYVKSLRGSGAERRNAAWDAYISAAECFSSLFPTVAVPGATFDEKVKVIEPDLEKEHDSATKYALKAIEQHPERPESYTSAIEAYYDSGDSKYYRSEEKDATIQPGAKHGSTRIKDINPVAAAGMLDLSRKGSEVDPDKAFFDLARAYVYYGMRRDVQARACLHQAAQRTRYDAYETRRMEAETRFALRNGWPDVEALVYCNAPSHDLSEVRRVSRLTVFQATAMNAQGRSAEAEGTLMDLFNTG